MSDVINKYLIVRVSDNYYAIDIFDIQSIVEYKQPTRLIGSPEEVLGLINHFDKLWSVIDLKKFYHKDFINVQLNEDGVPTEQSRGCKTILLFDQKNGLLVEEASRTENVEANDIKKVEIEGKEYSVINMNGQLACIINLAEILRKEIVAENEEKVEVVA
jgi:Chemotaxis signal transduction protein